MRKSAGEASASRVAGRLDLLMRTGSEEISGNSYKSMCDGNTALSSSQAMLCELMIPYQRFQLSSTHYVPYAYRDQGRYKRGDR